MFFFDFAGFHLELPDWFLLSVGCMIAYYLYMTWHFRVFADLGIPYEKPVPVLGNMYSMFTKGLFSHDEIMAKKYGKVVGVFMGRIPQLLITDREMIKQILVKDFLTFPRRSITLLGEGDELLDNMMTGVQDYHQWKALRTSMSPAFSSGKLRRMVQQMNVCADQMLKHLETKAIQGQVIDTKDYLGAYSLDLIGSTSFGIQVDSFSDEKSAFVKHAKKAFTFSFTGLNLLIPLFFHFLKPLAFRLKLLGLNQESRAFFLSVVKQAIHQKESSNGNKQLDFLQLMMNAHNETDEGKTDDCDDENETLQDGTEGKRKQLSELEILSQSILFFIAGYETIANTASFICYNLAVHPECQERARQEVQAVVKNQPDVKYDDLSKMTYLQQVMDETMRMYPQGFRLDREAAVDTEINGIKIPKGMNIIINIQALHYDPEVYPDPTTFDPERFSPENKAARDPFAYLPFGMGPRNCIGMRLAMMEMKVVLAKLLMKYKLVQCSETQVPMVLQKSQMVPENGFKLKIEILK